MEWKAPKSPDSESDFEQMMLSLDAFLNGQDLHVHQRPLQAAHLIAKAYGRGEAIPLIPRPSPDPNAPFSAAQMSSRAHDWYAQRYGQDTEVLPSIGHFLIELPHRTWKVRAPFTYGGGTLVCDRKLQDKKFNVISRGPITINMLDCFEGLTQDYANQISEAELDFIGPLFVEACEALNGLDALARDDQTFFHQAQADYNHSVEALTSVERNYGKARRDMATCAEKVMKGLLHAAGVEFKPTHYLPNLAVLLEDHCKIALDRSLVARLNTSASVSYDQVVPKSEALLAHRDLIRLLASIARQHFGA